VSGQQHAPAVLNPRERPGTHCTGGWVGPRAGLDGRKISPHRDSILGPIYNYNKSKAIPLQAWKGPEGSRRLRLPDVQTIGT